MPRRGFYLIVGPEHRQLGALPPVAWVDDLMRFHGLPYYVGLLSAAALHGAAHQQPQEFHVVTNAVLRPLTVGHVRMRFFFRHRMDLVATTQLKTLSGYIPISTPEMTAYDLVRYQGRAASIDHTATVLAELAEHLDATRLLSIAEIGEELPVIQRLGFLLDRTGHGDLAVGLARFIHARRLRMVPLEFQGSTKVSERDSRWHVLVNATIEVEA